MVCLNCRNKLNGNEDFCPNCGASLIGNKCDFCRSIVKNVEFKISSIRKIVDE